jgi:hypothetical protein
MTWDFATCTPVSEIGETVKRIPPRSRFAIITSTPWWIILASHWPPRVTSFFFLSAHSALGCHFQDGNVIFDISACSKHNQSDRLLTPLAFCGRVHPFAQFGSKSILHKSSKRYSQKLDGLLPLSPSPSIGSVIQVSTHCRLRAAS